MKWERTHHSSRFIRPWNAGVIGSGRHRNKMPNCKLNSRHWLADQLTCWWMGGGGGFVSAKVSEHSAMTMACKCFNAMFYCPYELLFNCRFGNSSNTLVCGICTYILNIFGEHMKRLHSSAKGWVKNGWRVFPPFSMPPTTSFVIESVFKIIGRNVSVRWVISWLILSSSHFLDHGKFRNNLWNSLYDLACSWSQCKPRL